MVAVSARSGSSDQGLDGRVPRKYDEKTREMSGSEVGSPHRRMASPGCEQDARVSARPREHAKERGRNAQEA